MTKLKIAAFSVFLCASIEPVLARAAEAAQGTIEWQALNTTFIYAIVGLVLLATFCTFAVVCRVLREHPGWSLTDALSEEADITIDDANGQPVKRTILAASSSRLIAFVGTIAILFLFLGFGALIMSEYSKTGRIDNADAIGKYLLTGLTLFVPYVVNKFSSVFAPK
jgi:hypothetical protein